ncbi:hypothetical protein A0O34_01045 [Chryseobacterium glaciei]|uniref:Uncharacterized protein n=1 Tax=Chryseobacterium glaciei TaxID=1685010 RepID=A0A172XQF2_9FLAO|nr:hypothetical protein [Chryseobacterium glaciei]ANF49228.1 hypothetical protein A0O34_01045 [Chryseobacterium glaciei]
MNKKIFNKKWLYLFSIFLFIYLVLFSFILLFQYYPDFYYFHVIVNTSLFLLSILTVILLIEKHKKSILTINLFFGVFILLIVFRLLFTVKPYGYFIRGQMFYLLFSIVYLTFVNKFKIREIKDLEINEIGKHND